MINDGLGIDSSDVEKGIYVVLVHYEGMIGMQFRNCACAEFGERSHTSNTTTTLV